MVHVNFMINKLRELHHALLRKLIEAVASFSIGHAK